MTTTELNSVCFVQALTTCGCVPQLPDCLIWINSFPKMKIGSCVNKNLVFTQCSPLTALMGNEV